jgi:hypothetical protein
MCLFAGGGDCLSGGKHSDESLNPEKEFQAGIVFGRCCGRTKMLVWDGAVAYRWFCSRSRLQLNSRIVPA